MLKIRLQRVGKKHEPVFRVVVCDSKRGPKSNDNVEVLGSYDPRDKNETVIDGDRVKHWISNGAQVSDTVTNILINKGIIKGEKINVLPKKSPVIDEEKLKAEEEAAEAKAKEEAEAAAAETPEEVSSEEETATEEVKEEAPAEPEEKKEDSESSEESKEG